MMKNLIAFAFSAFLLSCVGAPKTEEKSFIDENIDFARAQIGNEIGVIEASGKCLNPVTVLSIIVVMRIGGAAFSPDLSGICMN